MTREESALAAAVVFAGLWSGLLGMLTLGDHASDARRDGRPRLRALPAGLPPCWQEGVVQLRLRDRGWPSRRIVGLVALWDDRSSAAFILCAIGLALVVIGVYVVSNVWKEPHYDVMLAWDADAMPPEWEAGRQRYFTLNWIQAAATWPAFGVFLLASRGAGIRRYGLTLAQS